MTRVSTRTDRQRYRSRTPLALGWVFFLLAMLFCCSVTTSSAAAPAAAGPAGATAVRAFTPTPDAALETVVMTSPADRGLGTSCHGGSTHTAAVVLPASSAPVTVPSPVTFVPATPLTGAAAIRGPAHDGVRSVDQLRLQVQRI
ncbi:hypothetical protein OG473_05625 [Streptomyces anulatus]|uniref:Secreted protein n=1 Tax=Streptomyces anulatus TaxID=1892 RepID=A0ABZ1ZAK6_STRAQ|nr:MULTISPECIES: hypothetical protein [Streptomyces]OKI55588.1 hypothetical protein AMK17_21405 [Streptomyces sp. CB00072]WST89282.1 hypothetical protein OG238_35045 [Streptomyces anulatus]WTE30314.1 hypothetical protein OHB50_33945 [Streptomyces anulatus]